MTFRFYPDDENDLDELFDGLRDKLIQLDRKNVQTDLQCVEITKLVKDKSEVRSELEQLKIANQKLQGELNAAIKTMKVSERQIRETQEDNGRLKSENVVLKTENDKLVATQTKCIGELSDLKRKHCDVLGKVSTWHKVYEEVSQKQAQNQARMLEIAKQIGHSKASTLYIHQLKQQVEVVYKNAVETIKHMQESPGESNAKKFNSDQDDESFKMFGMDGCSDRSKPEKYWESVNEKVKTEMQNYKEELWAGLQSLSQLNDIKIAGSWSQ